MLLIVHAGFYEFNRINRDILAQLEFQQRVIFRERKNAIVPKIWIL